MKGTAQRKRHVLVAEPAQLDDPRLVRCQAHQGLDRPRGIEARKDAFHSPVTEDQRLNGSILVPPCSGEVEVVLAVVVKVLNLDMRTLYGNRIGKSDLQSDVAKSR